MISNSANQLTIAGVVWPETSGTKLLRGAILAVLGTILLWISAKIKVDIGPVPITMQSFVVLGLGAAMGWRLGLATLSLYMLEGLANLPVFTGTPEKGLGIAYMMGPTGGYLLGFVLAAGVVGWLAERGFDRNPLTMFGAMMIGTWVIYIPGILWMSVLFGPENAVKWGVAPFILGDALKAALAAALFPAVWALLGKKT